MPGTYHEDYGYFITISPKLGHSNGPGPPCAQVSFYGLPKRSPSKRISFQEEKGMRHGQWGDFFA